jgi:GH15 family glucan-1,4-alpha-glucosidase
MDETAPGRNSGRGTPYPPIADYALLSDCHSVALVSRHGSVDWCCMPRVDSPALFGRLLDWEHGGHCSIRPAEPDGRERERRYLDGSLVLESRIRGGGGEVRVLDCLAMRPGGRERPRRQLLRIVEGLEGEMELVVEVAPRFVYGDIRAWLRRHGEGLFTAIGGDAGLLLCSDMGLEIREQRDLRAELRVGAGDRFHLAVQYAEPHRLHPELRDGIERDALWDHLEETLEWWRRWSAQNDWDGDDPRVLSSAAVIKGLTHAPTGAIVAAATTSLPEHVGGERNWDYRYSWIRDSSFALEALGELGFHQEAHGFRHFLERTTAGDRVQVQPLYGVGGEHFLPEVHLDYLEGYRGSRPVRIGNDAFRQRQLDSYGELLELAWRSSLRGYPPEEDYWRFLRDVVDHVAARWTEPDRGFWEVRDGDHHFVHSKVTCWAALDRGLRLADEHGLDASRDEWRRHRGELRETILDRGVRDGSFVRELGGGEVDAVLLLLPRHGFVAYDDERMVRTVDRIRDELADDFGMIRRYRGEDGLAGEEGCFIACTFWLAECLALGGRRGEAREVFDRAAALANDLGLFSEEYDAAAGEMLGNFPQGLSHYSFVTAAVALQRGREAKGEG